MHLRDLVRRHDKAKRERETDLVKAIVNALGHSLS